MSRAISYRCSRASACASIMNRKQFWGLLNFVVPMIVLNSLMESKSFFRKVGHES
uniref:Uncharacterized protein n=1 Tax=Arundo donax TaxID=35708 RepID=A0A0A8YR58_ARUDO